MISRVVPTLAFFLAACASQSQSVPAEATAPLALIQMCPDLDRRDVFDCRAAERRRPECTLNPAKYKLLGNIDIASTGVSTDERDVYAAFAERARRLKPDAVIEVSREQRPGSNVWRLRGRAVTFLAPSCRNP